MTFDLGPGGQKGVSLPARDFGENVPGRCTRDGKELGMLEGWRPGRRGWSLVRRQIKWVGARSHRAVVVTSLSISFQIQGKPLRALEKGSHRVSGTFLEDQFQEGPKWV